MTAEPAKRNVWPLQSQCIQYYGNPGIGATHFDMTWFHSNIVAVCCPWQLTDGVHHFGHINIHRKCADSLARVLNAVYVACGKSQAEIEKRHYHIFSGTLAFRNMRTHAVPSMHMFGCAIDWDAPENPLHSMRPKFAADELLLECFRDEGWICGRDWRGSSVDAMHVQAARVG